MDHPVSVQHRHDSNLSEDRCSFIRRQARRLDGYDAMEKL